jgi:hypothetical protein
LARAGHVHSSSGVKLVVSWQQQQPGVHHVQLRLLAGCQPAGVGRSALLPCKPWLLLLVSLRTSSGFI